MIEHLFFQFSWISHQGNFHNCFTTSCSPNDFIFASVFFVVLEFYKVWFISVQQRFYRTILCYQMLFCFKSVVQWFFYIFTIKTLIFKLSMRCLSWQTLVKGNQNYYTKVWEGHYSFPRIAPLTLDLYLIILSVKQGDIKYLFSLNLWYDLTQDWTQVSWTIGEQSTHYAIFTYLKWLWRYIFVFYIIGDHKCCIKIPWKQTNKQVLTLLHRHINFYNYW